MKSIDILHQPLGLAACLRQSQELVDNLIAATRRSDAITGSFSDSFTDRFQAIELATLAVVALNED